MALQLFMIVLLILFTAFFVATEFAVIRIRPSRVDQLVLEGRKNAVALQKVTANLDGYLSACQLGITITSLGLGWLGEPTVEALLEPVFERLDMPEQVTGPVAFLIAFTSVTYLHVVIGELAPKSAAIRKAEPIALLCAVPIIWFNRIMYPFIWLLNSSANRLLESSLFGIWEFGVLPVDDSRAARTIRAIKEGLSVKTGVGGVARYTNDYYFQQSGDIEKIPGNPWIICTLWIANYEIESAKTLADLASPRRTLEWVVGKSLDSGVLPEQLNPFDGSPLAVAPLTWSHATFVQSVCKYVRKHAKLRSS